MLPMTMIQFLLKNLPRIPLFKDKSNEKEKRKKRESLRQIQTFQFS